MKLLTRRRLIALLLIPVILYLSVSLYVPTRFVSPAETERLRIRGESVATELTFPCDVLVWNIYKGDRAEFSDDLSDLADGRELLLLQEFHDNERVERGLAALSTVSFQLATSFLYRSDRSATGVATGSVAPVLASECFITSDTEPISHTPKATLVCRYAMAGETEDLLVINIHAINVAGLAAFENQLEQVREVLAKHGGPVLFAGDFNTNRTSKQAALREFMAEFELTEMDFSDDSRTTTPWFGLPIDYVFTRGLITSQASVAGLRDGSDHKAMMFRIDGLSE